ncbi:ApaG protein [Pedobacter sp. UYEF25]
MTTAITEGVKVSVETIFQPEYSNPGSDHFMFAYRVEISNLTENSVKLLSRHWYIFDSNSTKKEIEGEGVVGMQPVIDPGETHVYVSGCNLKTDLGSMKGYFTMKRLADNVLIDVDIPEFLLIAPYKLN